MVPEKKQFMQHSICIDNREKVTVSGVTEVISADNTEVNLNTSIGRLIIKGTGLSMGTLDVSSGELCFTGKIVSVEYKDSKKSGAGIARLFR